MSRHDTRALMAALKKTGDPGEVRCLALELLRHSLQLGHRRLSVKRLETAVECGAEVTPDDFHSCLELALRVSDRRVHQRIVQLGRRLEASRRER